MKFDPRTTTSERLKLALERIAEVEEENAQLKLILEAREEMRVIDSE
jgi:hypothetical protein